MRITRSISRFLKQEDGAVVVDFVVVACAVVGLGLIMIQAVAPQAAGITSNVESRYSTPRITVVGTDSGGLEG